MACSYSSDKEFSISHRFATSSKQVNHGADLFDDVMSLLICANYSDIKLSLSCQNKSAARGRIVRTYL